MNSTKKRRLLGAISAIAIAVGIAISGPSMASAAQPTLTATTVTQESTQVVAVDTALETVSAGAIEVASVKATFASGIKPMACRYVKKFAPEWWMINCYVVFTSGPPAMCYKTVYTCS